MKWIKAERQRDRKQYERFIDININLCINNNFEENLKIKNELSLERRCRYNGLKRSQRIKKQ